MSIRWKVTDILGNEIILRETTYLDHIMGDHSGKDSEYRAKLEGFAKRILEKPRYIVKDGERRLYYDVVAVEESPLKLSLMKVVVDADREPNIVVTYTLLRKGDTIKGGEIIYDISGKEI